MTRLSRRRRHNFRKNAVRDAENFRLTPMPQISGCKAHPAIRSQKEPETRRLKNRDHLARNRKFESISLQRRVNELSVPQRQTITSLSRRLLPEPEHRS